MCLREVLRWTARLGLTLSPLLIVAGVLRLTVPPEVSVDLIRERVLGISWGGPAYFVGIYVLAVLAQIPGSVVVGAGVVLYGPWMGALWCYLGALTANVVVFLLVRWAPIRFRFEHGAGRLSKHPAVQAVATRPLYGVVALRSVLPTAAMASAALALTRVSLQTYVLGSAIGLTPQLLLTVAIFAWAFRGQ